MATKRMGAQGQAVVAKIQERSAALHVQTVPIDSVKLWAENPRKNDTAVPKLKKLLAEHGQRTPIVVWDKNRTIYKGNTTWKAAKALGWSTIQAVFVSFPSDAAAAAYAIADNKSSEWSEWDDGVLAGILKSDEAFFVTNNTGFTEKELISVKLSTDAPKRYDIPKIIADETMTGDYIIIRFSSAEQAQKYRSYFGMTENERILDADKLSDYLK